MFLTFSCTFRYFSSVLPAVTGPRRLFDSKPLVPRWRSNEVPIRFLRCVLLTHFPSTNTAERAEVGLRAVADGGEVLGPPPEDARVPAGPRKIHPPRASAHQTASNPVSTLCLLCLRCALWFSFSVFAAWCVFRLKPLLFEVVHGARSPAEPPSCT